MVRRSDGFRLLPAFTDHNFMKDTTQKTSQLRHTMNSATLLACLVIVLTLCASARTDNPSALYTRRMELADRYFDRQEYGEALMLYRAALDSLPPDDSASGMASGNIAGSAPVPFTVRSEAGTDGSAGVNIPALLGVMRSLAGLGNYDALYALVSESISADSGVCQALSEEAVMLLTQGAQSARAVHDPDEAVRLFEMARSLIRFGQNSEALLYASEDIRIQLVPLYREIAVRDSLQSWQRYLEFNPDDVQALTSLASIYDSCGEYDQAVLYYKKALKSGGDTYSLKRRITDAYLGAARNAAPEAEEQAWQALLAWSPKNVEGYQGLASYYAAVGERIKALTVLETGFHETGSPVLKDSCEKAGRDAFEEVVRQILSEITTEEMTQEEKRRACFDYVLARAVYQRTMETPSGDWTKDYALDIYAFGTGNCYRYAAAFAYLCKAIGDDVKVCTGMIASSKGGLTPHGWVEINVSGTIYICDPDMDQMKEEDYYMKTFDQYPVKPLEKEAEWDIEF